MKFTKHSANAKRRFGLSILGTLGLVSSLGMGLMASNATMAQAAYPNKPIRYIVPFAPGGATDMLGRMVAQGLSKSLNQSVVVDNKAGQGGSVGSAELAKSKPDGYTLGGGTISSHALNVALYPKLPYDPSKDFAPITLLAALPNVPTFAELGIGQLGSETAVWWSVMAPAGLPQNIAVKLAEGTKQDLPADGVHANEPAGDGRFARLLEDLQQAGAERQAFAAAPAPTRFARMVAGSDFALPGPSGGRALPLGRALVL